MSATADDVKARLNQLRADKALLQAQLESLRRIPDAHPEPRDTLDAENDELGHQLRALEEKAILYRSAAWTCFEIDLDVGRRARLARRNESATAAADKDADLALGIRLDTFWRGRFYEPYYLVLARPSQMLESLPQLQGTTGADVEPSSLDGLRLIRHTVPHFVPLLKLVEKYLPSVLGGELSGGAPSAARDNEAGGLTMLAQFSDLPGVHAFLSDLHCHLQAYVSRRQQAMALRQLKLPGQNANASALEALGTEAFDMVKITWDIPSASAEAAEDDEDEVAANATAAAVQAVAKRKREVPHDEPTYQLEVVVRYADLQTDRLVDDTRPTGLFSMTSSSDEEEGEFDGLRRPYGHVRVHMLEYAPELEARQRRTPGISRAELGALRPEAVRRQDLELLYAQAHDGEALDMDDAFQRVAQRVWSQRAKSTVEWQCNVWMWGSRRRRRLLKSEIDPALYRKKAPDFRELARKHPTFARIVSDDGGYEAKIDFQDAHALRCLAETLLLHDFGVQATLSPTNLCPTIPNRLAYIALVHEMLCWTLPTWHLVHHFQGSTSSSEAVVGLDIGTGASVIYPVLGTRCFPHWRFVATDTDEASLQYASTHIVDRASNGLGDRIALLHSDGEAFVPEGKGWKQVGGKYEAQEAHFTMCNPPFYSSAHDMQRSASFKSQPPSAVCHGTASEMVVDGGEGEFVRRMLRESAVQAGVVWWTCMMGKLSSVVELAAELKAMAKSGNVGGWGVHELPTGRGRTKRWVVLWSRTPIRLPDPLARESLPSAVRDLPVATERRSKVFALGPNWTRREVQHVALDILDALDGCHVYASDCDDSAQLAGALDVVVSSECWTRRARRAKLQTNPVPTQEAQAKSGILLTARITVGEAHDAGIQVRMHWTYGMDAAKFESFAMFLIAAIERKVEEMRCN
ncbi:uncharacterized protein PSANT_04725 [Moesziomyces antarcticus]|uniref:S-adenosyl-L-methionine-dependent methyltransferase n=1 Tax=Pseudozyma antarctica TaxID=84753 RepID=A0A5C3FUJ0_PSEA2|nr:uncharacterized protein PSANT_04725 [Moesziomyces antarcticus]